VLEKTVRFKNMGSKNEESIEVPIDKDSLISYGFMCFCKRVESDNGSVTVTLR